MTAPNGVAVVVAADGRVELRLQPAGLALREQLGMTAWVALETLVLTADADPDEGVTVAASARDLASRLGVGKDRAAAALGALRDAGLIVRLPPPVGRSTRFAAHRYAIHLPVVASADTTEPVEADIAVRPRRKVTAAHVDVAHDEGRLFGVGS